jgi:hypothetical protein
LTDRRQWPRYSLDFPIRVEGVDQSGLSYVMAGRLRNISARGALGNIPGSLQVGSRVRFAIALPFSESIWLSYDGVVVRSKEADVGTDIAFRFTTARPIFSDVEPGLKNPGSSLV